MGRCHEFGSQIREGCSHPMRAGERACACPECGVVCQGQFDGCPDVWARGPRPVTFTMNATIDAPRVRALAAGPAPVRPAAPAAQLPPAPPPPVANGATNGNGNGRGAGYGAPVPPPPPPPQPPPLGAGQSTGSRTEVLQWFEDAFDDLRNELHAVVSTVTRQQAMLAELLDAREAELRVVMVAESLPELAGEAAAKALTDQSDGLAEIVTVALDDFRASVQAADMSSVAVMDGMRELLRRVELTAEVNMEEAREEGGARLSALKASLARQLKPLSASVAEVAGWIETADEREAARTRALKASVSRQLQPLAAAVEAAVERSDSQVAEIRARLDALGAPKVRAPRKAPAAKSAPARKAAPAPKAAPAAKPRAATRKRPAPTAEPETAALYDYDAPPAPAPGLLLRRRQARPGA
jgi:hypothetical protein